MKIEYDREANAAYIEINGAVEVENTIEVSESVFVDVDRFGMAIGVELLRPTVSASLALICRKVHVRDDQVDALERALRTIPMMVVQQNQLTSRSTVQAQQGDRPMEFS